MKWARLILSVTGNPDVVGSFLGIAPKKRLRVYRVDSTCLFSCATGQPSAFC